MEEVGVVLEVKDNGTAVVRMSKAGSCEACSAAGSCKAVSGDRVLEAENRAGAVPGQHVAVEIEAGAFLRASFLVYMMPVIFLFIGAALGGKYGPAISGSLTLDYWQAIGGILFLIASVVLIRLYNNKVRKDKGLKSVITKIMEGTHET